MTHIFKGAHIGTFGVSPQDLAENIRYLRDECGATLVRYQIVTIDNFPDPSMHYYIENFIFDYIRKLEAAASICNLDSTSSRFKVIIDVHKAPGADKLRVFKTGTPERQILKEAWRRIAEWGRNKPWVLGYDLLNEPGGSGRNLETKNWLKLAQSLYDIIRPIDSSKVVIVSHKGNHLKYYSEMKPIKGENVWYTLHMYSPSSMTHQGVRPSLPVGGAGWTGGSRGQTYIKNECRYARSFQKRYKVPMYVGEFGCTRFASKDSKFFQESYLTECKRVFEEYGWHWTFHAYREWDGWSVEHKLTTNLQDRQLDSSRNFIRTFFN